MTRTATTKQTTANNEKSLIPLPLNRDRLSMATIVDRGKLRYNMVLPDAVESRFRRIECEYAARARLAVHNLHYRQKILLYGVPGCGKTLGAERLAWNTGLTLVKVQFDSLISSLMGDTGKNLRKIFEEISDTPCVLFFDECDSILRTREDDKDVGEVKRIVNTFLQVLDEYNPDNGLVVMATNLTKSLDSAVWRRFDDVIELPKPSKREVQLLLIQTLNASFAKIQTDEFDWDIVLQETKGFSAAQIVKVAQNAAKAAILQHQIKTVTQSLLMDAIQEIKGMPSYE